MTHRHVAKTKRSTGIDLFPIRAWEKKQRSMKHAEKTQLHPASPAASASISFCASDLADAGRLGPSVEGAAKKRPCARPKSMMSCLELGFLVGLWGSFVLCFDRVYQVRWCGSSVFLVLAQSLLVRLVGNTSSCLVALGSLSVVGLIGLCGVMSIVCFRVVFFMVAWSVVACAFFLFVGSLACGIWLPHSEACCFVCVVHAGFVQEKTSSLKSLPIIAKTKTSPLSKPSLCCFPQ